MGWRSREPVLGEHTRLVTVNGVFRPFALVGGRAAATWRLHGREVALEPFTALSAEESAALEDDAADVIRFLSPARCAGARAPA